MTGRQVLTLIGALLGLWLVVEVAVAFIQRRRARSRHTDHLRGRP